MKNMVWLASYPRSGNTWLRVFLTNLVRNKNGPASINNLDPTPIFSSTRFLEKLVEYDVDCITSVEVDKLLPDAIRHYASLQTKDSIHKIHNARLKNQNGVFLVPHESTKSVIYIIRNPLDVYVSFACFLGIEDLDEAIGRFQHPNMTIGKSGKHFPSQLPQRIASWNEHVTSWTKAPDIDVHVFKYEDMQKYPIETFSKIAKTLQIPATLEKIQKAIDASSFSNLKHQEKLDGFREKPISAASFFRTGKTGAWRSVLSERQVHRIIEANFEQMTKYGYLDQAGSPLC